MPRKISESVVVITGASSGIGRATAHEFAKEGASLVLAVRSGEALEDVAAECRGTGAQVELVAVDVTDEDAVFRLTERAVERFGRVDVWVNNAAVTALGKFEDTPSEVFRRVIEVNLFGYINGARAVLPVFRDQQGGVLINVASVAGKVGEPYASAYVASKFGIVGFSEALRQELRDERGVYVCSILPPAVDTPLFQHAANYMGREVRALPPVIRAEDVALAIVDCAEHPRREVAVRGPAKRMTAMRSVAPRFAERRIAEKVEREHFGSSPAPESTGNLFEPDPGSDMLHGGWGGAKPSSIPAVAAGALALGLAALSARALSQPSRPTRFPQREQTAEDRISG
jgi:short-subunit dehydrogenase